jgi:hypothetical protein
MAQIQQLEGHVPEADSPTGASALPLEQIVAAQQLIAAAKHTKDAEDEAAFTAVWARGATLVIESNGRQLDPLKGREAILAFYRKNWRVGAHGSGAGREVHVAEPAHITAASEGRLLARHNAIFVAMDGAEPLLIGFARFHDELVYEDGNWRILTRHSIISRRSKSS